MVKGCSHKVDIFYIQHQTASKQGRVMTWGEAHRVAEKLQEEHPENTYWAEHIPRDYSQH